MASTLSLYQILGIPMSAGGQEIKTAYRRLARTYHPDVVPINQKEMSANEFLKIQAAYSTLSDPDKRAVYDRDLFRLKQRFGSLSASVTAASSTSSKLGYSTYSSPRKWESDQCW